jgi:hypothetical protein
MFRTLILVSYFVTLASGCHSPATRLRDNPSAAAALDPATRAKIEHGVVEPGFTPEMVYLALGQPAVPTHPDVNATRDGTWVYRDANRNDRDFIRAGFRRRVVFDPVRKSDVVTTEPIDPRVMPTLQDRELHVIFRDGRVTEIQRVAL